MKHPLVSVLINNYNYGNYLRQAIDSVLSQNYSKLEIVVVDDGSDDNSIDVLSSYSAEEVKAVLKENSGQASAFNAGFLAATGDLILLLDADDYFYPEKVSEIVSLFEKNSELGWIFHQLEYVNAKDEKIHVTSEPSLRIEKSQLIDVRQALTKGKRLNYTIPCGLCFRRKCIESILPMPESRGVTISDNYIKYAALSLFPGLILARKLAIQRIHNRNNYTFRSNNQKLQAEINVKTGYYLRKMFPQLKNLGNKLFARGCGEMIANGSSLYLIQMVEFKSFLSQSSVLVLTLLLFKSFLHVLLLEYKKVVAHVKSIARNKYAQ